MRQHITFKLTDDQGVEHTYALIQRGAAEGFDLAGRLIKILGPGLGSGLGSLKLSEDDEGGDAGISLEALGAGAGQICANLLAEGGHKLVMEVLKYTSRDGRPLSNTNDFNEAFQGNYGELFEVVWTVLKAEYGSVMTRLPFVRAGLGALTQAR